MNRLRSISSRAGDRATNQPGDYSREFNYWGAVRQVRASLTAGDFEMIAARFTGLFSDIVGTEPRVALTRDRIAEAEGGEVYVHNEGVVLGGLAVLHGKRFADRFGESATMVMNVKPREEGGVTFGQVEWQRHVAAVSLYAQAGDAHPELVSYMYANMFTGLQEQLPHLRFGQGIQMHGDVFSPYRRR